jgi:hypothetical protein
MKLELRSLGFIRAQTKPSVGNMLESNAKYLGAQSDQGRHRIGYGGVLMLRKIWPNNQCCEPEES